MWQPAVLCPKLSAQPLKLLTLQELVCWEVRIVSDKNINRNPIKKMQNCVSFFSAWSRKQPLGSWRCRASVPCLGGSFMSPVLPGVTVPTAWPPATSPTSEVESLCAVCISVAWGIFHPQQFFLTSVTKNNNNEPLGRKATFSFHGRGFDLVISRRGSSRSAGLCLQQRFHVALTSSQCALLYLISCRAISVLQWEVCFTHSAAKRKEVASLDSEMWGRKAVGNQAQPCLPSSSWIVAWLRTCTSEAVLPLSANLALLLESAHCLGNQPCSGFS